MKRCDWCEGNELLVHYNDQEWGVPVHKDIIHFEYLLLESMQAGLSWHTILIKRANIKSAFDNYDYQKIADYDTEKITKLMNNDGIIRHQKKIEATINNANQFQNIQQEYGSFNDYIWHFTDYKTIINHPKTTKDVPAKTELSKIISKDLKNRGFKFLGPVTTYSYLQAVGIIDDHLTSCFRKQEVQ